VNDLYIDKLAWPFPTPLPGLWDHLGLTHLDHLAMLEEIEMKIYYLEFLCSVGSGDVFGEG